MGKLMLLTFMDVDEEGLEVWNRIYVMEIRVSGIYWIFD
jgi:hypothetical protein